jgi:nucleoside-diphosphate-sugar epimerase
MELEFHQPVNLGNPEEYTVLELATLVQELLHSDLPLIHQSLPQDDPKQRKPDISRAISLLGWQPGVSVRDGLQKTIDYFKSIE